MLVVGVALAQLLRGLASSYTLECLASVLAYPSQRLLSDMVHGRMILTVPRVSLAVECTWPCGGYGRTGMAPRVYGVV
jgi:hypothetical protein